MDLDRLSCDRARRSRDARFDGRFFIAVTTTGIYCRPICPRARRKTRTSVISRAPLPRKPPDSALAFGAGRKRLPEAPPGTAPPGSCPGRSASSAKELSMAREWSAWRIASESRGGICAGSSASTSARHLSRWRSRAAFISRRSCLMRPGSGSRGSRSLPGFGSLRQFNARMRRTFRRTPTELRRRVRGRSASEHECYRFRLAFRAPYDWNGVLRFLESRAIPGVEAVDGSSYRRAIAVESRSGVIEVSHLPAASALALSVRFPDPQSLLLIVERVRRMFDLSADPAVIAKYLALDPLLRGLLERRPGVRVPGAWDEFELAATGLLGRRTAGRVAEAFGSAVSDAPGLQRLFPEPDRLARAPLEKVGMPPARAEAVRTLARGAASGEDIHSLLRALPEIPRSISESFRMRALGDPDAFPGLDRIPRRSSERWQPWRAYAYMLLHHRNRRTPRRRHAQLDRGPVAAVTVHGAS